jgi:hypothetical protein
MTRDQLRAAVTGFLETHARSANLTAGELESVLDSMLLARTLYEEADALPDTPAYAGRRADLRARADEASREAADITGLGGFALPSGSRVR